LTPTLRWPRTPAPTSSTKQPLGFMYSCVWCGVFRA
jgi:hypothetical protein